MPRRDVACQDSRRVVTWKDLPAVDVAQAGGWSSLEALKRAYQQPDDATMLRVVTHQAELRDVR